MPLPPPPPPPPNPLPSLPPSLPHHLFLSLSPCHTVFFFTFPRSGLHIIHPVPSEALRLYLGVHLTLHYSESAAAMRPKLSVRHREHAAPCRTHRTQGSFTDYTCSLLIGPSLTDLRPALYRRNLHLFVSAGAVG